MQLPLTEISHFYNQKVLAYKRHDGSILLLAI